jgi:hypothetical protein
MAASTPVYAISLPEYRIEPETDWQAVGRKLDRIIERHFPDRRIAIRGIGLVDHPDRSLDDLVSIILQIGTDRCDPQREGLYYEPCEASNTPIHAGPHIVSQELRSLRSKHASLPSAMAEVVEIFYGGALADRGYSVRLDILMIYRLDLLAVFPPDPDVPPEESCCFTFRHPDRKLEALLGIIKILRQ